MSNYIQVKNFGGADRGLKFNNGAMDVYFQRINYVEVGASAIYAAFYAGLIGNDIAKGVQSDYTPEQVSEWVDELYEQNREQEIEAVCNMLAETNVYKKRLEDLKEKIRALQEVETPDEDKKKEQ